MTTSPPTIATWQAASAGGVLAVDRLQQLRARLAASGAPVYLHVTGSGALDQQLRALQARAAECGSAAALGKALPLFGVPFVVKDNIDVAGAPTTAACAAFERRPTRHASVVQRLIDAGAVWLAKCNLDQFATGLVGTRSPYGAPDSVLAPGRISGGSSSGSAVAVARGDVPFALGTDTAGSGRVPAMFNGLVGFKPTPGRVGTSGVVPACRSLDCVSVLAHSVADAAAVLALIEGPDADDSFSAFRTGAADLPAALRLGVPAPLRALEPAYAAAFDRACTAAVAQGHRLVPLDFAPLDQVAALLYDGPWVAERHAVVRSLLADHPDALDPVVARVISEASRYSATDAFEALYALRDLARQIAPLWQQVDALLVPTAPCHPTRAEVESDPVGVNARLGLFTNFVNLLGWCALALPAGTTRDGLPFGITLVARARADAALARAGARWRGEAPPQPGAPWPACEATLPLAVVGAHLSGLPLNHQLTERGATLRETVRSAPLYRLHALPGTHPPKPGLVRVTDGETGHAIELEVWDLPQAQVGSFLALVPPPLALGSLVLGDGRTVHGFLCEPHALHGAADISRFGGWRAYLAAL